MKQTGKGKKGDMWIEFVAFAVAHNEHGCQWHRAPLASPAT
jgi:hypothetical protein